MPRIPMVHEAACEAASLLGLLLRIAAFVWCLECALFLSARVPHGTAAGAFATIAVLLFGGMASLVAFAVTPALFVAATVGILVVVGRVRSKAP